MIQPPPLSTLFPYTTLFRSFSQYWIFIKSFFNATCNYPKLVFLKFMNTRSEEHTSELQSHVNLVCRLLLEKKMLLLVWLIFFMVLIKLLPILGTISGKTVNLIVFALFF